MTPKAAISAIDRAGVLLVFPLDNRKEPPSLWSSFFPRSEMRWEWDEGGDDRVSRLWHLRAELSTTRKVVYAKWYQGRATYFSKSVFQAMLRALNPQGVVVESLSLTARRILSILEQESPLSTKEIKRLADLKGRENERVYERSLKELWSRMLIVAFGEVDDGAFPSLAIGATSVLFEKLFDEAFEMSPEVADARVRKLLSKDSLFLKHYDKLKRAGLTAPLNRKAGGPRRHGPRVAGVVKFEDL